MVLTCQLPGTGSVLGQHCVLQPDGGGSPGNLVISCDTPLENAPGFSGAGISCNASRQSAMRHTRRRLAACSS